MKVPRDEVPPPADPPPAEEPPPAPPLGDEPPPEAGVVPAPVAGVGLAPTGVGVEPPPIGAWVGVGVEDTVLFTVMVMVFEVLLLPATSVATAVRVCDPFGTPTVFQVPEYGAVVSVARVIPSSLNSTLSIPLFTWPTTVGSCAVADMVTEFETVVLVRGEVMVTVGGVVSGERDEPPTVIGIPVEVVTLLAASLATAVIV